MIVKKLLIIGIFTCFLQAETLMHNGVSYETVVSPYTGRIWLDRNLGASRACISDDDDACGGYLYQWSRGNDGHQYKDSFTVDIRNISPVLNSSYIESRFVTSIDGDWMKDINNDGRHVSDWSKTDGSSICPKGFRVPLYEEFKLEYINSGKLDNPKIEHFLNLKNLKIRDQYGGTISRQIGEYASIWVNDYKGAIWDFANWHTNPTSGLSSGYGLPVRCIGDKGAIIGMSKVKEHSLEIFLASHIYNRKAEDLYKTYRVSFLGKTSNVMLVYYQNKPSSGFTAGIYKVLSGDQTGKYIISFGGTGAGDTTTEPNAMMPDVITDLNLLNFTKEDEQIRQTRLFLDSQDVDAILGGVDNEDIIISGHSLGGGLAQYASMYKGYKAITVNTAPVPISEESQSYITYGVTDIAKANFTTYLKYKDQITNFMVPLDPLTSMLYFVEAYETNRKNDTKRMDNVISALNGYSWFQTIQVADTLLSTPLFEAKYKKVQEYFIKDLAYVFADLTNDEFDDSKEIDTMAFYRAISYLKYKDLEGFISNMKLAYGIPSILKLENLIIGERLILPMDTPLIEAHLMQPFLDATSRYFGIFGSNALETKIDTDRDTINDTVEMYLKLNPEVKNTVKYVDTKEKNIDLLSGHLDGQSTLNDADIYIIKPSKSGTYTFYTSGNSDTVGKLYNSNYKILLEDDDSGNNYNFKITKHLNINETYYLKVSTFYSFDVASYLLTVKIPKSKYVTIPFGNDIVIVSPY